MKIILPILFIVGLTSCSDSPLPKTGLEGTPLPSFNVLLMDSTTKFNTSELGNDKPVILFYFNPDCPYCRAQTETFIADIGFFKDIQLCILTYALYPQAKRYYEHYKLEIYPNIIVGIDYTTFLGKHFKVQEVPYIIVYDKNKKLKQILIGKVDTKVIKNVIEG